MTTIRVLGIVGAPRSGSTILSSVLGEVRGLVAVGELHHFWRNDLLGKRCGCGVPFAECPVWGRVREQVVNGHIDSNRMLELRRRELPTWRLAVTAVRPRAPAELRPYLGALGDLYRSLFEVTDSAVVVDSSKGPRYFQLLEQIDGLDVRLVHLVRDPRAVAFSRSRRDRIEAPHPARTAILWSARNLAAETYWRGQPSYLRIRYEDFASRPRETVTRILAHAGEREPEPPVAPDGTVTLGENHIISGNRSRHRRGETTISLRDEWQRGLPESHQAVVTALTLPLLLKYGYSLAPRRQVGANLAAERA